VLWRRFLGAGVRVPECPGFCRAKMGPLFDPGFDERVGCRGSAEASALAGGVGARAFRALGHLSDNSVMRLGGTDTYSRPLDSPSSVPRRDQALNLSEKCPGVSFDSRQFIPEREGAGGWIEWDLLGWVGGSDQRRSAVNPEVAGSSPVEPAIPSIISVTVDSDCHRNRASIVTQRIRHV
jgi:hypothetical protein